MKRTVALLVLSSLILASCRPTPTPKPSDPGSVAPAAPVVGQSVELQAIPGTAESAAKQMIALTDRNNPDMDPDLKALLGVFSGTSPTALNLRSLGSFGQGLAQGFGGKGKMTVQALTTIQYALPTGTFTYTRTGGRTYSAQPADGYVIINEADNARVEFNWKVGGAATVWVNNGHQYNYATNQYQQVQLEVPTNARGSLTAAGKTVAGLTFTMTPGDCLNSAGPTALALSAWAGRANNAPAKVDLNYAWTERDISLSGSALYSTKSQKASANLKLNVTGTTSDRCGTAFSFTPTRADLTGTLDIPSHRTELAVYLRDLGNLEFSEKAMTVADPFAKISGTVNGSLKFNGASVITASGPLADGTDMDLIPGDQVKVQYVKSGALIKTDMAGAMHDLGILFGAGLN